MTPDCTITWNLFNSDGHQWITTHCKDEAGEYGLKVTVARDILHKVIVGFGVNEGQRGRVIAKVSLIIHEGRFALFIKSLEHLLERERYIQETVNLLLYGLACSWGLIQMTKAQQEEFQPFAY